MPSHSKGSARPHTQLSLMLPIAGRLSAAKAQAQKSARERLLADLESVGLKRPVSKG
jgi:hypothetical protein